TSFATSRFHHDVAVCLVRPFILPHTSSVACNKQSFKPVQMFSKSLASLLDSLACTFSTKRLCMSGSFRHHTFRLLTNSFIFFLIFAPRCDTLTNSLCCEMQASPGITFTSFSFARSLSFTRIESTTVLHPPDSYVIFFASSLLNIVFAITKSMAQANSKSHSPSMLRLPNPLPPCTP